MMLHYLAEKNRNHKIPIRISVGNSEQGNVIQQMLPDLDIQNTSYTHDFGEKKTFIANMNEYLKKKTEILTSITTQKK